MTPDTEVQGRSRRRRHRLLPVALAVVLTGCASSPSRFYQLQSQSDRTPLVGDPPSGQPTTLAIGPVHIPDYLDRPQIVTRVGDNELNVSEFQRWAGPLESEVTRVLLDDISGLLHEDRFSVVRWAPPLDHQRPASCRVEVFVESFEGALGDSVILKSRWIVLDQGSSVLLKEETLTREPVAGPHHDALAASMSRALGTLSRDIGQGVTSVCGKGPPAG